MTHPPPPAQAPPTTSFAALKNVVLMMQLHQRLKDRGPHLPGIGVMHGFSGYGKTYAAIYLSNKTNAARVEIGDSWTKKTLLQAILRELGEPRPKGTIPALAEMAIEKLAARDAPPLIIDEADKLIDKGMIELVREIHESAQVPVILIGEEALPHKLERSERTHNRVLEWVAAQPCDAADTRKLAAIFAPRLSFADDIITAIMTASQGKARRIVTNLDRIKEWAFEQGATELSAASYSGGFQPVSAPPRQSRRAA
ncbi:MAG: AAA family ATPase [Bosea sp.]|jgi:DNA transposition AAA+ family ATPase|nr:AAA family ATPase [Bosea sp. (in: a-proteobacteria)]